jgi:hypothetical protein
MQKTILICTALLIVLCSGNCKKNNGENPPADLGDYQPMTETSEWNYIVTGGTAPGPYKITATNKDTTVNGRSYRVMTNSTGSNEYYNKTGSDYYRFARLAEFNNQTLELLYLKDNLAKGLTWTETKSINVTLSPPVGTVPVTAKLTFTVAEKGIDHTVNTTVFKDVIKITAVPELTAIVFGTPTVVPVASSDIQYYYARKVGLIQNKTAISIPTAGINTNTETKITSYIIK